MKRTLALVPVIALVATADAQLASRSSAPADISGQQLRQERLRSNTSAIAGDVATLTREFQRNGLGGDDVDILEAIGTVLGSVSAEHMPAILEQLAAAREKKPEPAAAAGHLINAYGTQKSVAIQLREVVLAYGRQVELHDLAHRARTLGDRQSLNLHETASLIFAARKGNAARRQDEFEVTAQLVSSEQESLRDELAAVTSRLSQIAVNSMASLENRAAVVSQFAASSRVADHLETAADEIDDERPMSSTTHQADARDDLWRLAHLLVSDRSPLEQIIDALDRLDAVIAGQETLVNTVADLSEPSTAKGDDDDEDEDDHRRFRFVDLAEKRLETLARDQGHLADRTTFLAESLRERTPAVVPFLEAAAAPMHTARLAYPIDDTVVARRDKIAPPTADALTKLLQARELLLVAIEEFEITSEIPADRLTDLRELLEETRAIREAQEQLNRETAEAESTENDAALTDKALDQAALTQKTQALERAAQVPAPEAVAPIAEAAEHMQTSADALQQAENLPATQQAAVEALERAEQAIEDQIEALEQAAEQLAALEELRENLTELIADQQDLQQETTGAAAQPEPSQESSDALAESQNELKKEAYQLARQAIQEAGANLEVPRGLNRAAVEMEEAIGQLEENDPTGAQPEQAEALEKLGDALSALDEQIADLHQELGTTPPMADLASANEAISEAQQQVSEALSQLSPQADAISQLTDRQQAVADALAEQPAAQQAESPTSQAQQAAEQAASELASGVLPQASESMQQALDALAEASASGESPPAGLAAEQEAIQAMTEQLAAQGTQSALDPLQAASDAIEPLTSGQQGALPQAAAEALSNAQSQLAESAAEAAAGNAPPATAQAQAAQSSLAEAAAALALSEAGLAMSQQPGQGQMPGEGMSQQPGEGQAQGQGQQPGKGQGEPPPTGTGDEGNWAGAGGADGPRRNTTGSSKFIGLPDRKRGSLTQSRGERLPAEFGEDIGRYFKKLSEAASDDGN